MKKNPEQKSVFKNISAFDVYLVLVTLAYLAWRFRVFFERFSG